jgi:hypothetical protein
MERLCKHVSIIEEALKAAFSVDPLRGSDSTDQVQGVDTVELSVRLGLLTSRERKLKVRYQETSSENIVEE